MHACAIVTASLLAATNPGPQLAAAPAADPFAEPTGPEEKDPSTPSEPTQPAGPQSSDATAKETPASPAAPAPLPGVPAGVDLFDETTWESLSPEEKDRMRAMRAEILYQQQQAKKRAAAPELARQATLEEEIDESMAPARRVSERQRAEVAWEERDRSLVTATAVTGALWGVAFIVTVALAATIQNNVKDCVESLSNLACNNASKSASNLAIPMYVTATITGAAGTGMLVSGIFLGVHRANPPYVARRGSMWALSPSGVRVHF